MAYFREDEVPSELSHQLGDNRVADLKQELKRRGLLGTYKTLEDFAVKVGWDLLKVIWPMVTKDPNVDPQPKALAFWSTASCEPVLIRGEGYTEAVGAVHLEVVGGRERSTSR
jgi:hypothetical protein